MEKIRLEIGAKKGDLNKAIKLVDGKVHRITRVGRWSQQVANLEDMILIALVDGKLTESESDVVSEFAGQIGVNQTQLDAIQSEVEKRLVEITGATCPSCQAEVQADAKFCPKCGSPILVASQKSADAQAYEVPSSGVAIEFSESTSSNFDVILNAAKSAPLFKAALKGTKCWYLAAWPEGRVLDAMDLGGLLSGLRNRKLHIDGTERSWDEVFGFSWCASGRAKAFKPIDYCFGKDEKRLNPFGCRNVRMEWSDWAQWFAYGKFKKEGVFEKKLIWVFDKERIKHEAMQNLNRFRFCPHINLRLVDAVVEALPSEVDPSKDKDWEFKHAYDDVPGAEKIVRIEKQDGMEWRDEHMVFGVKPNGFGAFRKLMTAALATAGVSNVTAAELIKP